MPNRLVKLGTSTYVPDVPSVPAREAYCVVRYATRAKQQSIDAVRVASSGPVQAGTPPAPIYAPTSHDTAIYLSSTTPEYGAGLGYITTVTRGGAQTGGGSPAQVKPAPVIYETYAVGVECFPAVAGVQGQAAYTAVDNKVGWNAGARSITALTGDCYAEFVLPLTPIGIVCGFANADTSTLPGDVTHGIYAHGSDIDIMERGQVIATSPVPPDEAPLIRIVRVDSVVTYYVGDWVMRSPTQSGGVVFLDAALYSAGDFVNDPVFAPIADLPDDLAQTGSGAVVLPAVAFIGGIDYAQGAPELAALRMSGTGAAGSFGAVTLPAVAFIGGIDYAQGGAAFAPVTVVGDGGYPEIVVSVGSITLPPVLVSGVSLVGAVGTGGITLDPLAFLGADRPYAAGNVVLRNVFYAYGDDGPELGTYGTIERLYFYDYAYTDPTVFAVVYDGLELSDEATFVIAADSGYYDGLILADNFSLSALLQAVIRDGLALSSGSGTANAAAIQYAVNIATGALTTYQNFDFTGFAKLPLATYGWRADGVYRIGGSTDDGVLLNALLDFGADDLGTNFKKHIPAAFLGLGTDGCAYLKMTADTGCEQVYRVIQRNDVCRANPHRGISAREWYVKLELTDASSAVLDNIEYAIEVTTRRWTR